MAKEDATMTDAEAKPAKGADDSKQSKDAKLKGKGKAEDASADLSEEDQAIKANLEMMVERARDSDPSIQANALEVRPHLYTSLSNLRLELVPPPPNRGRTAPASPCHNTPACPLVRRGIPGALPQPPAPRSRHCTHQMVLTPGPPSSRAIPAPCSIHFARTGRGLEVIIDLLRFPRLGDQLSFFGNLDRQAMRTAIKEATASMTSVPKPLKFLRSHYGELKATFAGIAAGTNSQSLADILSVLAMTAGAEGGRESLQFRLKGSSEAVGSWGHEYVRWVQGFGKFTRTSGGFRV